MLVIGVESTSPCRRPCVLVIVGLPHGLLHLHAAWRRMAGRVQVEQQLLKQLGGARSWSPDARGCGALPVQKTKITYSTRRCCTVRFQALAWHKDAATQSC